MSQEKFYTQAKVAFLKLEPKEGDVIAITLPVDMAYEQVLSTVTYLQDVADEFGCNVVILSQGADVQIIPEEEMNKLGWYRKPRNVH